MTSSSYHEAVRYLADYATDDWVMLSVVVSEARGVANLSASRAEVAGIAVDLASALMQLDVVPGDLVEEFVPWPGSGEERLARLRSELLEFVARGELPLGAEVCWFHKIV